MAGGKGRRWFSRLVGFLGVPTKEHFTWLTNAGGRDSTSYQIDTGLGTRGGEELASFLGGGADTAGVSAEVQAQRQLSMAAGLSRAKEQASAQLSGALDSTLAARAEQLGALEQQAMRPEGQMVSDLEQELVEQELNQSAAVSALAGGGPLSAAAVQHGFAGGAGGRGLEFASARSTEMGRHESNLLGNFSGVREQDVANERLVQSVVLAKMQNAARQQEQLTRGSARLQLGKEQDLFRLHSAEQETREALRAAALNSPRREGLLGGILGAAGAVVGGIYGGAAGAHAGGTAGASTGRAIQDEYAGGPAQYEGSTMWQGGSPY